MDAGIVSVMCGYNKVHGEWVTANKRRLTQDLRGAMGFRGYVMGDWGAAHDTRNSLAAGLDMDMPSGEAKGRGYSNKSQKTENPWKSGLSFLILVSETNRKTHSPEVDDKTAWELYYSKES